MGKTRIFTCVVATKEEDSDRPIIDVFSFTMAMNYVKDEKKNKVEVRRVAKDFLTNVHKSVSPRQIAADPLGKPVVDAAANFMMDSDTTIGDLYEASDQIVMFRDF